MAEIVQELMTRDTIRAKAAAALGLNQPNPEDVIHREDYESDAAFAVALARLTQTMNTPEYRAAARKVGVTAQKQNEDEEREAQRKEYAEIRKTVKLDSVDLERIDKEALTLARQQLAEGKIAYSQLGETVETIAKQLTERVKDRKAGNIQLNAAFRREAKRGHEKG